MRHKKFILVLTVFLLLALVLPYAVVFAKESKPYPSKVIRLIVRGDAIIIENSVVRLPIKEEVSGVLSRVGAVVVGEDASTYDATLSISVESKWYKLGMTVSIRPDGIFLSDLSGPGLSGEVVLKVGRDVYSFKLERHRNPSTSVVFLREGPLPMQPSGAPFLTALIDLSNFYTILGQIIGKLYSPTYLIDIMLKDQDWRVRRTAAEALGEIKDPRAVEPLIAALKDQDRQVRQAAAEALGKMKNPRAVEPLIVALRDQDSRFRQGAAIALGEMKNPRAVEPLIAALKDSDSDVREAAAKALGKMKDPKAVEPLIAALKDSDSDVREAAAIALGEIKDPRAVEPLIAALKDQDRQVRQGAAIALGEIKDTKAVEPLIAALKDQDRQVRQGAAQALGEIKDPRAVGPLKELAIKDKDPDVRKAAKEALKKIEGR